MTTDQLADGPLAPVAQALRERACRDATAVSEASAAQAAQVLTEAEAQAEAVLAQARAAGQAEAAAVAARTRVHGRRQARTTVLAARRRAYEELRAAARAAVGAELTAPAVRDALIAMAQHALGGEAVIRDEGPGAITATAGARRVRLSLDELADAAVATLEAAP